MLSNAYLLAKFRFDTAENERKFAEILPKTDNGQSRRALLPSFLKPKERLGEGTFGAVWRCQPQEGPTGTRREKKFSTFPVPTSFLSFPAAMPVGVENEQKIPNPVDEQTLKT